jgi:PAS domain S-box-containing protein
MEKKDSSRKGTSTTKLLLSQAIDFLPDSTFAIDLKGKVIVWNRAMEAMTAIKPEDMIGKGAYEYSLPFYGERRPILIDLILHPDPDMNKEYTFVRREGDTLFAEAVGLPMKRNLWGKASPIYNNKGQIIGAIESIRDITDKKKTEENLIHTMNTYRAIFENTSSAMVILDEDTTISLMNSEFEYLSGYRHDEVEGKMSWHDFVAAEEIERMQPLHVLRRKAPASAPRRYEFRFKDKAGAIKDILLTVDIIEGTTKSVASLLDITEWKNAERALRRSQEKYHDFFLNVSDLLFIHDLKGSFIETNLASKKSTGYTDTDLVNMNLKDILPKRFKNLFKDFINRLLENGYDEGLMTITAKTGEERILEYRSSLILDTEGNPARVRGSAHDITSRIRTSKQLKKDSDFITSIIQTSPAFYDAVDPQGKVIFMNQSMLNALGYSLSEVAGKDYLELFIPEEDRADSMDAMARMISSKGPIVHENRVLTKACSTLLVQWQGKAMFRETGELEFVFGIGIDISQQRHAQELVQSSEKKFETIFQSSPVPSAITDIDTGMIINANTALESLTGITLEEVVSKTCLDIGIWNNPADRDRIIHKIVSGNTVDNEEVEYRVKNGEIRNILYSGRLIDINGKPYVLSHSQDITAHKQAEEALKESEERYRILAENARDVIWILDLDLKYIYMSPSVKRLRGYSAEEAMKQSLDKVLTPESYRSAMDIFHKELGLERMGQIHGPDWSRTIEIEMYRKDGSTVWSEVIINLLYDEEGALTSCMGITRDITKRKRIEEDLRESEEKFRLLFEKSGDANLILDEGRYIDCNEAALKMAGCIDKSQLLSLRPAEAASQFQPDGSLSAEKADRMMELAIENGSHQFEWVRKRFDGTDVYLDVVLTAIPMKGRRLIYTTWRDISERKRTDEALRASEEKFSTVFRTSPTLMAINTYDEGRYIDVNEEFLATLGYAKEEVIGRTADEVGIYPDTSYLLQARKIFQETGGLNNYELLVRTKDGHIRSGLFSADVIKFQGRQFWLTVMTDITEKKETEEALRKSEERFRMMAEVSPEIFWMATPDWEKVTFVSPALWRIAGITPDEVYQDPRAWLNLVHPEDKGYVSSAIGFGQGQADDAEYDFRIIRKDGVVRWIHTRRFAVHNEQGNLICFTGISEDITERKLSEEERRTYEARLMRSQKLEAIGTLAGGIAHDFNNILSAIIGYSELAIDELPPDSDVFTSIKEVLKAGDRAKDLVKQILTFSRQMETERTPIKPHLIIKEALKLLRSSIPSTITITERIDTSAGTVFADSTQIHQVIMNLCTNAYHALLPTGGDLMVSLEQLYLDSGFISKHPPLSEGAHLLITVRDTGSGMDTETLKRIFDPFFTTKEKANGTGLGLATVHGIITDLGGVILVESSINKGSTFEIYLPVSQQEQEDMDDLNEEPTQGTGESILLVDDEEAIINFTKAILNQLGYKVKGICSSIDALSYFRSVPDEIDLVITDQTMPGITGSQLATEILKIRPDLPIILMTGYSETITAEEAVAQGIKEYLDKPFTKNILAGAIRRLLEG